jgi:xylulokinase
MTENLCLGLDVGSSSTKAVLVDVDGTVVADARLEHGIERPRPGWAEQDAERDWWGDVVEV